jgi:hypothetical protein
MKEKKKLSPEDWDRVLERLAGVLSSDHQRHVTVIGGVAVALAYGSRRTTDDADVIIIDPAIAGEVLAAVAQIAPEFELPLDWMNEKARKAGHVPASISADKVVREWPSLALEVPSAEQLLAMKVTRFAGDTDTKDAKILLKVLINSGRSDVEAVWDVVGGYVPLAKQANARDNLQDVWEMLSNDPA